MYGPLLAGAALMSIYGPSYELGIEIKPGTSASV